ncbi:MAG: MlaD family protein [Gemmatimonas sp.]
MRISNLAIGTTTLALITSVVVGMLSVQKLRHAEQRSALRIVFDGSASGLRKGGAVNFDGVPAGEITSIKLENPRRTVAMVMLENSAPIRKDTAVGIEYQGLTGLAAISLIGGAASAPPVPLDHDGIPVLTADWSERQSITDTLHDVDKVIADNRAELRDGLLSFETYTASLKSKGEALDGIIDKAENAFSGFDNTVTKIDSLVPGAADGKTRELFEKVRALREMADQFRHKSAAYMEETRRNLFDISDAADRMSQKFDPRAAANPARPRSGNFRR